MVELAGWLFFFGSLWGAWFTYNAHRPLVHSAFAPVSWFAGWLTTELAVHHILWQAVLVAVFLWIGVQDTFPGMLGLFATAVSWVGLAACAWKARGTGFVVEHALVSGLGTDYRERMRPELKPAGQVLDLRELLLPLPIPRRGVERIRDLVYARQAGINLKLDVYRRLDRPSGCPVLLQIHGGGWVFGSKNEQAVPLMCHLARRGWVSVSINYRLSPHATFPDHLVDVKRAIAWVRANIAEYGGDPERIVVTGGSAGGHLCSLAALTANDPAYQPGFEDVDTSVMACVSFYGVYDFTNRFGYWRHGTIDRLIERQIMKASLAEARAAYEAASPMSHLRPGVPPFMVIHGTNDTLVPVEEARRFCALFRSQAHSPLVYVELPGAQHAFEVFPSLRTAFVIAGVDRFLAWVLSRQP